MTLCGKTPTFLSIKLCAFTFIPTLHFELEAAVNRTYLKIVK